jgi:hypothetical protein
VKIVFSSVRIAVTKVRNPLLEINFAKYFINLPPIRYTFKNEKYKQELCQEYLFCRAKPIEGLQQAV